jgi:hypothetical protein
MHNTGVSELMDFVCRQAQYTHGTYLTVVGRLLENPNGHMYVEPDVRLRKWRKHFKIDKVLRIVED